MFRLRGQREIINFLKDKTTQISIFKRDIANCKKENLNIDHDGKYPSLNEYFFTKQHRAQ